MSDTKHSEHETTPTSWRDKTLKAAGVGYIVGDTAMAVAGGLRGKVGWRESVGGALTWLIGGVAAANYCIPNVQHQLEIQSSKLEAHLKKNGITIPEDARAQSELLKNKTVWDHVQQFMYEHPSEMLNTMYALGAGMLIHGAIKNDFAKLDKTLLPHGLNAAAFENISTQFWIGAVVATGAAIGLFVKEDPHAREKKDQGGFIDHAIAYVKEKPLRASAALYTVNNGFLAMKAWQDYIARDVTYGAQHFKPHYASGLQLAAYLLSNALLFSSSRSQITQQGFGEQDMAKLENAAAAAIAAQSPQTQQALLAEVSEFMATQKGVTMPAEEIAAHLALRVTELTHDRLKIAADNVKSFATSEINRREDSAMAPVRA